TSMIVGYSRQGNLNRARTLFDSSQDEDPVRWNAMIQGYAHNGHSREALELFGAMVVEGVRPDQATFVGVLAACNHVGVVANARSCLVSMIADHGLEDPRVEHFYSMLDVLARNGRLGEAEELIQTMPFEPDTVAWTSLLA
ncbi:hypothetical protein SELMODRAFT_72370, partial [Selaginella moellendorffii]